MKVTRLLPSLAAMVAILSGASLFGAAEVGKPAPDFTLTSTAGNSHSLSDFKGKYVLLEWTNYGCPFVVKFYQPGEMQRLQEKWTAKGVVWLTINSTNPNHQDYMTPAQHLELDERLKSRFTAKLMDSDGKVGRLYGARVTPQIYVIDPEGTLIYNGAIDSIRSTNAGDIEKADNYVNGVLKAAMAGNPLPVPAIPPYGCSIKY